VLWKLTVVPLCGLPLAAFVAAWKAGSLNDARSTGVALSCLLVTVLVGAGIHTLPMSVLADGSHPVRSNSQSVHSGPARITFEAIWWVLILPVGFCLIWALLTAALVLGSDAVPLSPAQWRTAIEHGQPLVPRSVGKMVDAQDVRPDDCITFVGDKLMRVRCGSPVAEYKVTRVSDDKCAAEEGWQQYGDLYVCYVRP
jgi:hypothetical protein